MKRKRFSEAQIIGVLRGRGRGQETGPLPETWDHRANVPSVAGPSMGACGSPTSHGSSSLRPEPAVEEAVG